MGFMPGIMPGIMPGMLGIMLGMEGMPPGMLPLLPAGELWPGIIIPGMPCIMPGLARCPSEQLRPRHCHSWHATARTCIFQLRREPLEASRTRRWACHGQRLKGFHTAQDSDI